MRETSFIRQNEEKWKAFEEYLEGEQRKPEELGKLFVQITDDLSYARTFYPNRSVRVYLNGLAQRAFFKIYKGKASKWRRFVNFWTEGLPHLLYEARKELLLSLLIFLLAMAIGMLSSAANPAFPRIILGDHYIDMTEANIQAGDPMAVYKQDGELNMFLGITLNNIMVALRTFIMGVFYAIGTVGSLLYNGVMLGAFQYFFIEKGLFGESFLTIWQHGAFEISSIVIAGAAGLTMGKGLLFPGTLYRLRSFQLAARRGMSIMAGTIPLFILAGFVESYLTRNTEVPDVLRGAFIVVCFAFVLFYFAFLPWLNHRKGGVAGGEEQLSPDIDRRVDFSAIKTTGDLFTDAFIFYRKNFRLVVTVSLPAAILYCVGVFSLAAEPPEEVFFFPVGMFSSFQVLPQLVYNSYNPAFTLFAVLALALVAFFVQRNIAAKSRERDEGLWSSLKSDLIFAFAPYIIFMGGALLTLSFLDLLNWAFLLIYFLLFPVSFIWLQVMLARPLSWRSGLKRTGFLVKQMYGQILGLWIALFLCGILFLLILDSGSFLLMGDGVIWLILETISVNIPISPQFAAVFFPVLTTFIFCFAFLLVFGFWATGLGLQYYSLLEVKEATFLKEKIRQLGKRKSIRGLEREA